MVRTNNKNLLPGYKSMPCNRLSLPRHVTRLLFALALLAPTGLVMAQSVNNTMTNIAEVVDACDIVAIGIDFGEIPASVGASAIVPSATANTALASQNADHPDRAADGTAANDDALSIAATGIGAVDTAVSALLTAINSAVPGIYVACTAAPTSVVLTTATGSLNFPTTVAGAAAFAAANTVGGQMDQVDGAGAIVAGGDDLDYTLTFVGAPATTADLNAVVALIPAFYVGIFAATGTIDAGQTLATGFYTEVATATVNF